MCGKITPVEVPSLFDVWEYGDVPKYRTTNENGKYVWVQLDNYNSYNAKKWSITDTTTLCDECIQTKDLALKLQKLNQEDLTALKENINLQKKH